MFTKQLEEDLNYTYHKNLLHKTIGRRFELYIS